MVTRKNYFIKLINGHVNVTPNWKALNCILTKIKVVKCFFSLDVIISCAFVRRAIHRTRNFGHFHIIFQSVVQTNIKWRFVSYSSHSIITIKAIYPLVILMEMPFGNKIDTKNGNDLEGFSVSLGTTSDNFFIYSTEKDEKSFQLTIALYYLPIVLTCSMQTITSFLLLYGHQTGKCCKILLGTFSHGIAL